VGCDRGRCVIGTSSTHIVSIVYADFEREWVSDGWVRCDGKQGCQNEWGVTEVGA
jgi:hypothetical protein